MSHSQSLTDQCQSVFDICTVDFSVMACTNYYYYYHHHRRRRRRENMFQLLFHFSDFYCVF